ncbi:ankyrin repeat-containing domain protein [Podospora didyma]|uniref:Ankyrin repeat-containing domain protein n=1 Tax=Podospora didyma TaxID=330526 RepID=A0AAE0JXW1_9PEZI|nr:ankyrin repeat-containing domain protein [Podospora didyma]
MARFRSLPPELVLEIGGWLEDHFSLAALVRTNSVCRDLLKPILYTRYGQKAVRWSVESGRLDVIKYALSYAKTDEEKARLVNGRMYFEDEDDDLMGWAIFRDNYDLEPFTTPLHAACSKGLDDIVTCLLDNGAEMDATSNAWCDCLNLDDQLGMQYNDEEIYDFPRWMPLHHAICHKQASTALLLLERGAPLRVSVGMPDTNPLPISALQSAAENGLPTVVRWLKAHYRKLRAQSSTNPADEDLRDPRLGDTWGNTAMHYLALCFDYNAAYAIARDLQELGLHVDERGGRRDCTPLLLACCLGNFSAARAFLKAGAYPQAILDEDYDYDDGEGDTTCLDNALRAPYGPIAIKFQSLAEWEAERLQFIKELIEAGVDVDELPGDHKTPLIIAAQRGLANELRLLLDQGGALVNAVGESKSTALMHACDHRRLDCVEVLLAAGASVNQTNSLGATAIDYAINFHVHQNDSPDSMKDIVIALLRYGARVGIPYHDPHGVDRAPCIHESFLLRAMRKAQKHAVQDHTSNLLNILLEHSTQANITRECWQAAVVEAVNISIPQPGDLDVCKKLGRFGRKHGYVFDDAVLTKFVFSLLKEGEHRSLEPFLALGGGKTLRTATGVFTRQALLALAMIIPRMEGVKFGKLVTSMVDKTHDVAGKILLLKSKSTLFHLACGGMNREIVERLLDRGCFDINAFNAHSMTPLAEATRVGDIDTVKILLEYGADPYITNKDAEGRVVLPQLDPAEDFLRDPEGRQLARCIAEMVASMDQPPADFDAPSAFEIVSANVQIENTGTIANF